MKTEYLIIVAIIAIAVVFFMAQGGAVPRTAGQRTSVAGSPDKVLGGQI